MSNFEELKIVGFDDSRPPRVRKEAYIDLHFSLSHKAPEDWCEDFNHLGRQVNPSPKIDVNKGVCIDSYVSSMDLITEHLDAVKSVLANCNSQYIEKLRQQEIALAASNSALHGQGGEQNRLNQIVAAIDFSS
jgi:hypothetical protein